MSACSSLLFLLLQRLGALRVDVQSELVGLYLPTSPHISPHLPLSPHIAPYLPISPYISPYLPTSQVGLDCIEHEGPPPISDAISGLSPVISGLSPVISGRPPNSSRHGLQEARVLTRALPLTLPLTV